jgi:hypothetical protein
MFKIDNVKCIHHTKASDGSIKAIKVTGFFFDCGPVWIPDYAVSEDSEVWHTGDRGTLIVTDKFAESKGWL